MESPSMAANHGFAPGFRFVPTDEEVVRLHLLRCIQGQPQPRHDIIVDDPLSAPPWALLEKHGRKQEAFFFAEGKAMNAKGNRQKRTCAGYGTWQGQRKRKHQEEGEGKDSKKRMRVSMGGGSMEIDWEKYALSFHERGVTGSTGWVMQEYSITSPPELARSPIRVYYISHSGHGKNAKKHSKDAQDWGSDAEDVDEEDDANLATTWCTAEEDPGLFIGEYMLAPQAEFVTSLPVAVADVGNAIPADGVEEVAGNDPDLPALVEDDATTWCAEGENPALCSGEYPLGSLAEYIISLPVAVANVVNANPADGLGAGAGNDQDLPTLVEDDATTWCAAEEDPTLSIGEYPLAPQAEYAISLAVAVADVVNANPADGVEEVAGNDPDLPALVEDDATTWCAEEEAPNQFIGEYPLAPQAEYVISVPVAVADVVNANLADGAGTGAGNNHDLPAPVQDNDYLAFMNSLSDLVPDFDLSQ